MSEWLPIRYVDFYDVPRLFAVEHDPPVLFDCPFSDLIDDYGDSYDVYRLPSLPGRTDLSEARSRGVRLGAVRVADVEFDPTHRAAVRASILSQFEGWLEEAAPAPWWDRHGKFQFHVRAEIKMLDSAEGGRKSPISDGYRAPLVRGDDGRGPTVQRLRPPS